MWPFTRKPEPEPSDLDLFIADRVGVPLATHSDAAAADVLSRIPYWEFLTIQGPFQTGTHLWACLPRRGAEPPPPTLGGIGDTRAEAQCDCVRRVLEFCDGLEAAGHVWWREKFASLVGTRGISKATAHHGWSTVRDSLIVRGQRPSRWKRFWNVVTGRPHRNEQLGAPGQTCWCWCPECAHDLCSQPDNVQEDLDGDLIVFECTVCGAVSSWDFVTSPVPLLMAEPHELSSDGELARVDLGSGFAIRDAAEYRVKHEATA